MGNIFYASSGGLRSGWKIGRILLLALLILILISLVANSFLGKDYSSQFVLPLSFILSTYISNNIIEKKKLNKIGLRKFDYKSMQDILFGFIIALISCFIIFIVLVLLNEINLAKFNISNNIMKIGVIGLLYWICIGLGEEIVFRGYIISNLPKEYDFWIKNVVSAIFFSLLHMINPSYNSIILFLYAFLIGLYLGYLFKITGAIWINIGFHFSWNYFQSLFSIPEKGIWVYIILTVVLILNFIFVKMCYAKLINKNQKNKI